MVPKDKNQTPAPKSSGKGQYEESGLQNKPAAENLQSHVNEKVSPTHAETTSEQQAQRSPDNLKIPKIKEGADKKEHDDKQK
jgi:hypothetical protein